MALGLDIAETQEVILNYMSANKPSAYELLEADIPDSWERAMVNGACTDDVDCAVLGYSTIRRLGILLRASVGRILFLVSGVQSCFHTTGRP